MPRLVVFVAMLLTMACSKQTAAIAGPSALADHVLVLRHQRTAKSLGGVAANVEGVVGTFVSTSDGALRLPDEAIGKLVQLCAPGFLHCRRLRYSANNATEFLFPEDQDFSYGILLAAIYRNDPVNGRVWKTRAQALTVFPDAAFRTGRGREAVDHAVAQMNATRDILAARNPAVVLPTFAVAQNDQEPSSFRLRVVLDPEHEELQRQPTAGAVTIRDYSGYTVVGATIVFRSIELFHGDHLPRAVLHEATHALGLGHLPPGVPGVMGAGVPLQFTPAELDLLSFTVLRPGGTKAVDDSSEAPSVGVSGLLAWSEVVCHLRP